MNIVHTLQCLRAPSKVSGKSLKLTDTFKSVQKIFKLSEKIPDSWFLKSFQGVHKSFRVFIYALERLKTFHSVQKLSKISQSFQEYPETFQSVRKISKLSWSSKLSKVSKLSVIFLECPEYLKNFSNYSNYLESFQIILKFFTVSQTFPEFMDSVQSDHKFSILSKTGYFPNCLKCCEDNF